MIALIIRDLRISVRAGGGFGLSLAFFFIIVIFFPFAIGPDLDLLSKVAPGTLWVGALLACLLSLERIFALDFEDGTLDLLATSSLPLESVVISKALVHWLTTGLPLVLLTPFFGIFLGYIRMAYKSLSLPIMLHGINNLFAFFMAYYFY